MDEEELEEEQDPCVRTTSSGRILKLLNRFLLKTLPNESPVSRAVEKLRRTSSLFNHIHVYS